MKNGSELSHDFDEPTDMEARAQFERRSVEVALARASGNRTRAAAELGLSRQCLLKTMTRLGLDARPET